MATRVLTIGSTSGSGEGETISSGSGELRWKYRTGLGVAGALIVLMALWAGSAPFWRRLWTLARRPRPVALGPRARDARRAPGGSRTACRVGVDPIGALRRPRSRARRRDDRRADRRRRRLLVRDRPRRLAAAGRPPLPARERRRRDPRREVAFALGPGLFLAVLGAFVCEFAALQSDSRPLQVVTPPVEAPVAAPTPIPTEGPRWQGTRLHSAVRNAACSGRDRERGRRRIGALASTIGSVRVGARERSPCPPERRPPEPSPAGAI